MDYSNPKHEYVDHSLKHVYTDHSLKPDYAEMTCPKPDNSVQHYALFLLMFPGQLSSHVLTVAGIRVRNALQVENNNILSTWPSIRFAFMRRLSTSLLGHQVNRTQPEPNPIRVVRRRWWMTHSQSPCQNLCQNLCRTRLLWTTLISEEFSIWQQRIHLTSGINVFLVYFQREKKTKEKNFILI